LGTQIVSVSGPYIIDILSVIGIKDAHAVFQYTYMAEAYSCTGARCFLRIQGDLVDEVLILRHIRIIPWADTIAGYAEAAHVYIGGGVLHLDTVRGDIIVAPVCRPEKYPGFVSMM
jgi:hypothetical protein